MLVPPCVFGLLREPIYLQEVGGDRARRPGVAALAGLEGRLRGGREIEFCEARCEKIDSPSLLRTGRVGPKERIGRVVDCWR